jgi:hypothetical protein
MLYPTWPDISGTTKVKMGSTEGQVPGVEGTQSKVSIQRARPRDGREARVQSAFIESGKRL